ncbi:MAG: T9SS type A sorting domain-containing protein, partial [Ignavibacteriota bacterium]
PSNAILPDSALFIFTPAVDGADGDTVKVIMIDTAKRSPYISLTGKNFFDALPGSQHCSDVIIDNKNNTPVIVTSITISGNGASDFAFNPAPSFPFTIGEFTKTTVPFCYNAPNARGTYSTPHFDVTYHADGAAEYTQTTTLYGSTVDCIGVTPDTIEFGSLIAGGNAQSEIEVTNTFDHTITLSGESWQNDTNGSSFSLLSPTFPITLGSKETKKLNFNFAPALTTFGRCYAIYNLNFTGADDSTCTSMQVNLEGLSVDPTDTARNTFQLFPNVSSAMPILSDQQKTSKDFIFYNNSPNKVKVISVSVKDGTHFAIVSPTTSDLPITLAPNEQMKVTISFDANMNGYYNDELDISTENGFATHSFSLQAVRTNGIPAGVASHVAITPQITLSPNPSRGEVMISIADANIRSIAIYDMLGNLISSQNGSSNWKWDGTAENGELSYAGTYFVRAEGISASGDHFVTTSKLSRK